MWRLLRGDARRVQPPLARVAPTSDDDFDIGHEGDLISAGAADHESAAASKGDFLQDLH